MLNARMPKNLPNPLQHVGEAWPFVSRPLHLHDTHQKIWACPHFATIRWKQKDMHGGKIQKIERDGLVAILWNTSVDMFVDKILLVDVTFMSVIFGETV